MDIPGVVKMLEFGWSPGISQEQAVMYLTGLGDLDPTEAQRAVLRLLRTEEYRPSVARVRREVLSGGLPEFTVALAQAEALLRYRDGLRYVNGSGYRPSEPEVHPVVVEVCRGLGLSRDWRGEFSRRWKGRQGGVS